MIAMSTECFDLPGPSNANREPIPPGGAGAAPQRQMKDLLVSTDNSEEQLKLLRETEDCDFREETLMNWFMKWDYAQREWDHAVTGTMAG